jgi:hypothetical protein
MKTSGGDGKSAFSFVLDGPAEERPAEPVTIPGGPLRRPVVPAVDQTAPLPARLLHWAVNVWPGQTLTVRDVYRYGPHPIRNRESALNQTRLLVEAGWLEPIKKPRRRDRVEYRVARGPGAPTAA